MTKIVHLDAVAHAGTAIPGAGYPGCRREGGEREFTSARTAPGIIPARGIHHKRDREPGVRRFTTKKRMLRGANPNSIENKGRLEDQTHSNPFTKPLVNGFSLANARIMSKLRYFLEKLRSPYLESM